MGRTRSSSLIQVLMGLALLLPVCATAQVTCVQGTAVIGPWSSFWEPGPPGPASNDPDITIWSHRDYARVRHQFLFRAAELDFMWNGGLPGPCPGQPIDSLSFYIMDTIASGDQKPYGWRMLIRHSTVNALTQFDNAVDTAARCAVSNDALHGMPALPDGTPMMEPTLGPPGWRTFRFDPPFIWNGTDAILVEFCYSSITSLVPAPTIWCTVPVVSGVSSTFNRRASHGNGPCAPADGCGTASIGGCAMEMSCGMSGTSSQRPVIRFNGAISTLGTSIEGSLQAPPQLWYDPATQHIVISGNAPTGSRVAVYDASGRLVLGPLHVWHQIDAGSLTSGLYSVKVLGTDVRSFRILVGEP